VTKKAQAEAELARLAAYAQKWFNDLNAEVFEDKLPKATVLKWNPKLTATAGKASYARDKFGVETSLIDLATKILTNEGLCLLRSASVSNLCSFRAYTFDLIT
jgi:hypothetical protein